MIPLREETVDYYYYLRLIKGLNTESSLFKMRCAPAFARETSSSRLADGLGTYSFFAAQSGAKRVYAIEKRE